MLRSNTTEFTVMTEDATLFLRECLTLPDACRALRERYGLDLGGVEAIAPVSPISNVSAVSCV